MKRIVRSIAATAALAIVAAVLVVGPGVAGAASSASTSAPVGTLTAGKAHRVDVRTVKPVKAPAAPKNAFINRPTVPMAQYKAAKLQGLRHPGGLRPGAASPPRATNNGGFDGINASGSGGFFPPDINGTVSQGYWSEIVNSRLASYLRSNNTKVRDQSLAAVTGYTNQAIFDPRIVYDTFYNRYIMTAETFEESPSLQYLIIMVSVNPNPSIAGLYTYFINAKQICGNDVFYDYPQVGFNQDGIVITGNCFRNSDGAYLGARAVGIAKAILYLGGGFSTPVFSVATADSTTTPTLVLDQFPHMDMLTRNGPNQVRFNNPANGFYGSLTDFGAVTGFTAPSTPRNAGQAGCTVASCTIDTSDGRFVAPGVEYSNELWNVASYGLSGNGTFATPTWGEFNRDTHAAIQHGTRFSDGCSDDWNASITASPTNDSAWLNWSSSDPQGSACGGTFVRILEATRITSDSAGSMPSAIIANTSPAELTGNFDPNFGAQRWGDTSSITLDPANSATQAWAWQQTVVNASTWGTRVQKVGNP